MSTPTCGSCARDQGLPAPDHQRPCPKHFAILERVRLQLRYWRKPGDPKADEVAEPPQEMVIRHQPPQPRKRKPTKPTGSKPHRYKVRKEPAEAVDWRSRILAALASGPMRPGQLAEACRAGSKGKSAGYLPARHQLVTDGDIIALRGTPPRFGLAGTPNQLKRLRHADWSKRILAALAAGELDSAALAAGCDTDGRGGSYHRGLITLIDSGEVVRTPAGLGFVYSLPVTDVVPAAPA